MDSSYGKRWAISSTPGSAARASISCSNLSARPVTKARDSSSTRAMPTIGHEALISTNSVVRRMTLASFSAVGLGSSPTAEEANSARARLSRHRQRKGAKRMTDMADSGNKLSDERTLTCLKAESKRLSPAGDGSASRPGACPADGERPFAQADRAEAPKGRTVGIFPSSGHGYPRQERV